MKPFTSKILMAGLLASHIVQANSMDEFIHNCDLEAVKVYLQNNRLSSLDRTRYLDLAEHIICKVDKEFDLYNSHKKMDHEPGALVAIFGVMGMLFSGTLFVDGGYYNKYWAPPFLAMLGLTVLGIKSCDSGRAKKNKKKRLDDCSNALAIKQLIYQS